MSVQFGPYVPLRDRPALPVVKPFAQDVKGEEKYEGKRAFVRSVSFDTNFHIACFTEDLYMHLYGLGTVRRNGYYIFGGAAAQFVHAYTVAAYKEKIDVDFPPTTDVDVMMALTRDFTAEQVFKVVARFASQSASLKSAKPGGCKKPKHREGAVLLFGWANIYVEPGLSAEKFRIKVDTSIAGHERREYEGTKNFGLIIGVYLGPCTPPADGLGIDEVVDATNVETQPNADLTQPNDSAPRPGDEGEQAEQLFFCVEQNFLEGVPGVYDTAVTLRGPPFPEDLVPFGRCIVHKEISRASLDGEQATNRLNSQWNIFTDASGLAPASGYCYVNDNDRRAWNWMSDVLQPWRVYLNDVAESPPGFDPPPVIARVFARPSFYARVLAVNGNGQRAEGAPADSSHTDNYNAWLFLDFGPHFAAFHRQPNINYNQPDRRYYVYGPSSRRYDYEQIREHQITLLSEEEAEPWLDEEVRTLHNATLAWKYSGRQKLMYQKRRWLMIQPEWVAMRRAQQRDPVRRTLEDAAKNDDDVHVFGEGRGRVETHGLGPVRGLLWLHLPLLQSAERQMPAYNVVTEIDRLYLVARARSVINSTRRIFPDSALREIAHSRPVRQQEEDEAAEGELNDDIPGGSAAFPHDCFFGWSKMKMPLHADLTFDAAPPGGDGEPEAPEAPPEAPARAPLRLTPAERAAHRDFERSPAGQAARAAANAAAAVAALARPRRPPRRPRHRPESEDGDDSCDDPGDREAGRRGGLRYVAHASLARVQDTDPDGLEVTHFATPVSARTHANTVRGIGAPTSYGCNLRKRNVVHGAHQINWRKCRVPQNKPLRRRKWSCIVRLHRVTKNTADCFRRTFCLPEGCASASFAVKKTS